MLHYLGRPLFIVLFLGLSPMVYAQSFSGEDKKNWFNADKLFEYGDYLNASEQYKQLLQLDSANEELNYKIGVCYFNLPNKKEDSAPYFKMVKSKQFIELDYYSGQLLHLSRKYKQAIKKYEHYKLTKEFNRLFSDDIVNTLILKSRTAQLYEKDANTQIQLVNMGEQINSPYADYGPKISAEGNELYFTSRRENSIWKSKDVYGNYFENIFYSIKDSNWTKPIVLGDEINTDFNDACTGISSSGDKMLIFRTSSDLKSGDIFESEYIGDNWSTPLKLDKNVNSNDYIETSACYSSDGNSIYFSSNRPGGYGGMDLYVVKKLPNGQWGEAYNLGPEINTKYNETSPFVHPSGTKLFFSSGGHENMGGYDIFQSSFDEFGKYNSPENLKYPINTNDDDLFFVLSTDEKTGYLSSKRKGGYGSYDIYEVKMENEQSSFQVYKINVFDKSNNPINKFQVKLIDLNSSQMIGKYKSNKETGKMIIISEPNKEYEISIEADGYENYKSQLIFNSTYYLTFVLEENHNDE